MRARGPAGVAAQPYDLSSFYLIPFLYFEFGKMEVKGQQALPVIQHDEVSLEIQRPRQQDRAGIHGSDGRAAGDAEIKAKGRALSLSVEAALGVEDVRNFRVGGRGE